MALWSGPNRRNIETPQIEFCDLCGAMVGAGDRIQLFVEGLDGLWVCPNHAEFISNPSFNDLGGTSQAVEPNEPIEPSSGEDWTGGGW